MARDVFVEIESMESAAEARFQVAQQDVDPAKLGEIIGMTSTSYYRSVTTACYDDRAEAGEPIRKNRAATRQVLSCPVSKRLCVNPATGEILAWIGCPAAFKKIAATMGTMFSDPRPALPPGRSPPR